MPIRTFSEIRGMWLFTLFDVPVDTKEGKREYRQLRKGLVGEGFSMLQYSVYARYCVTEDKAVAFRERLKSALPSEGQVRFLMVTDKQFAKMQVFLGEKRIATEKPGDQLSFF